MKQLPSLAAVSILAVLTACGANTRSGSADSPATEFVINDVSLIDPLTGIQARQSVVVSGDEITRVENFVAGRYQELPSVDGRGKFLIPGLWDFHVHLTYDDRFLETMPAMFLAYGITSVRDTGGLMHKMLPVVERMRAQAALAPRVFFAGPLLDGSDVVYDGESRPEIGVSNASPAVARQQIDELVAQGVDFIKIYELVSADVFAAMAARAEQLGVPIASHVPLSMLASEAGLHVDSIEHLRNIELDCAVNYAPLQQRRLQVLANPNAIPGFDVRASLHSEQRLPAVADYDEQRCDSVIASLNNTTQVPTLRLNAMSAFPPQQRNGWNEALALSPTSVKQDWENSTPSNAGADTRFAQWSLFLTGRMNSRGVPVAAGTDTPIGLAVPGFSLHSELEMLVAAGLTPLQALRSATLVPAQFFRLDQEMGTIAVGKKADMVLLNSNPLDNIANSKDIAAVVSKGHFFAVEELREPLRQRSE